MKLYDYYRSSAAYRVRIALALKGAAYDTVSIDLKEGEQRGAAFSALNPQMRIPAIEVEGRIAAQSLAIIEWIDETVDGPSLLPADAWQRLRARAFADTIACDVHPLNNPSVLTVLRKDYGADEAAILRWYHDWIARGFTALEVTAAQRTGAFLFGDAPGIAEITLVPQVYNARRFDMDLSNFPNLVAVDAACCALPAFQSAAPEAVKR